MGYSQGQRLQVSGEQIAWLCKALKSVHYFKNLTLGQTEEILKNFHLFRYPAKTTIIKQGASDEALFVIYKGKVGVVKSHLVFFSKNIASLGAGEFFGEIALLQNASRSASVSTTEVSDIFVLLAKDFSLMLSKSPELAAYMKRVANERKKALG